MCKRLGPVRVGCSKFVLCVCVCARARVSVCDVVCVRVRMRVSRSGGRHENKTTDNTKNNNAEDHYVYKTTRK